MWLHNEMRARNLGHIGVAAAMVLGLVIAVLAGAKLRRGSQSILTNPPEQPTSQPSNLPSMLPSSSSAPTSQPSTLPSSLPSARPTLSTYPSSQPSLQPSLSTAPSSMPSSTPSISAMPSESPSFIPSAIPSASSAPSEFFGTNTTIFLDSRSRSAFTVAVILIIAFTYATMYMCGKDHQSKDHCAGNNIFSNMFQNGGCHHERDPECDESEIQSQSISRSRHEEDDTIDTNNVYSMSCTANNSIDTRVRDMGMKSPSCDRIQSSPIQLNIESVSEADSKLQDVDLEDGRGGKLPNSIAISNYFSSPFKRSGISPLRTPKVFKKRQHGKSTRDVRLNQDRNSSVYVRGNTQRRNITRQKQERNHSLADDMMSENNDSQTNNESPESYNTFTKCGLNRGRPMGTDMSAPDGEGGVECLAYERQKKRKIRVHDLHKDDLSDARVQLQLTQMKAQPVDGIETSHLHRGRLLKTI